MFFAQHSWNERILQRLYRNVSLPECFISEFLITCRRNFVFGVYNETCTVKLTVLWIGTIHVKAYVKRRRNRKRRSPSKVVQRKIEST